MFGFYRSFIAFMTAAMTVFFITGCSSDAKKSEPSNYDRLMNSDSVPQNIKNIVRAINDNNPEEFAAVVDYPLERPYPLKDIENKDEMIAYYKTVVDDSLRNVILNSTPEDWQEFGWRGYSVHDGNYMWVDESIYAMNYLSRREQVMLDSLSSVEKKSLPGELGSGWQPVLTLLSPETGTAYRIDMLAPADRRESNKYRLAVYDNYRNRDALLEMPSKIMGGNIEVEGTANTISYIFHNDEGEEYDIYPDFPGTGKPLLTLPDGSQTDLTKAYWHELIR